jgi:hypothetical protein
VNPVILRNNYAIVNLAFIGIIVPIILYSLVFSADGLKHPVPSGTVLMRDKDTLSTGLSRSFSEIVRLNFKQARLYNPYGIRIFLFFMIQLLLRITALIIIFYFPGKLPASLYKCDIAVSILLFMVFFWPFIQHMAGQVLLIIHP